MLRERSKVVVALVSLLIVLIPVYKASSDEWPMFHKDPQRTGYTDCEMPDELELLWKYELNYATYIITVGSPVIYANKLYVTSGGFSDPLSPHLEYLYCIDAATGKLLWKYKLPIEPFLSTSPVISNERVYAGSTDSLMCCLDTITGELMWTYGVEDERLGSLYPVIYNNKIYVGSFMGGNSVCCLDINKHCILWKFHTKDETSSLALFDSKVYFASWYYIYCLNADSGNLVWKYKFNRYGYLSACPPVVTGGRVYMGADDNYIYCFNAYSGKLIWKYKTDASIRTSPAVTNSKIYITSGDGYIYCLNAKTGKLIWKYKIGSASSPVISIDKVYVSVGGFDNTYVYCLNANTGKLISKYDIGTDIPNISDPIIYDNRIYLCSTNTKTYQGYIYCFGGKKSSTTSKTKTSFTKEIKLKDYSYSSGIENYSTLAKLLNFLKLKNTQALGTFKCKLAPLEDIKEAEVVVKAKYIKAEDYFMFCGKYAFTNIGLIDLPLDKLKTETKRYKLNKDSNFFSGTIKLGYWSPFDILPGMVLGKYGGGYLELPRMSISGNEPIYVSAEIEKIEGLSVNNEKFSFEINEPIDTSYEKMIEEYNSNNNLVVSMYCPTKLMVSDSRGKKIGYSDGKTYSEIENGFYSGVKNEFQLIIISNPEKEYKIVVETVEAGKYSLYAFTVSRGKLYEELIAEKTNISSGKIDEYFLTLNSTHNANRYMFLYILGLVVILVIVIIVIPKYFVSKRKKELKK